MHYCSPRVVLFLAHSLSCSLPLIAACPAHVLAAAVAVSRSAVLCASPASSPSPLSAKWAWWDSDEAHRSDVSSLDAFLQLVSDRLDLTSSTEQSNKAATRYRDDKRCVISGQLHQPNRTSGTAATS